ncbi:cupin domain-containing protein [Actinoplanes sp. NBRC 103695]|uniref:cupin domain-containing protein n=1 Tax=Actinoplanes sp. NBRC 103695 TaxID=3032202 RepID=UPI0024A5B0A9|nr:cupin domain-containing protein [Actinoplanes sp. NBRC 103695]GLY97227.1 cupin [Actinoplanes sp. NBRC 103695]
MVKLIVTGQRSDGTSAVAEESEPLPLAGAAFPGLRNTPLWTSDRPPGLPHDGSRAPRTTMLPPAGGVRYFLLTIDPVDPAASTPTPDQLADFDRLFPGLLDAWDADGSGMEITDTVDFGIVIDGSIVLRLDDGAERTLRAGDAFVQHGTHHGWRNPGPGPVTLAVVLLGATRSGRSPGTG